LGGTRLRGRALAECTEGKQRRGRRGAVEAAAKVTDDSVHGIMHSCTQTFEVWAEDNVSWSSVGFQGNPEGEERDQLLVGVVGKRRGDEIGVQS
jgi:hypothetical protein